MALKIPASFDFRAEQLNPNETAIRDDLGLNVENWVRFRYTIHIGNDASCLYSTTGLIDPNVKQAYIELAKSHYEVVTSLGCTKLSFDEVENSLRVAPLAFKKSVKDFYFHAGCLLDNLARLIYIVNDPSSARETLRRRNRQRLMRHWVDWGSLRLYPGYARLKQSVRLREMVNIRNNLTHSWTTPIALHPDTGTPYWPLAARRKRDLYWPYEEGKMMRTRYRTWIELIPMMRDDLAFLEKLQNRVFGKLVRDIRKFERNYGVTIQ